MAKKKTRNSSNGGRRSREKQSAWLRALALERVPVGTGVREFGQGSHAYVKSNLVDGSTRIFWFDTAAAATRACRDGVRSDAAEAWDAELDWSEAS